MTIYKLDDVNLRRDADRKFKKLVDKLPDHKRGVAEQVYLAILGDLSFDSVQKDFDRIRLEMVAAGKRPEPTFFSRGTQRCNGKTEQVRDRVGDRGCRCLHGPTEEIAQIDL